MRCSNVFRSGGVSFGKVLGGVAMILFVIAAGGALVYKMSERSNPSASAKGGLYENASATAPKAQAPSTAQKRTTTSSGSTQHPPRPKPKPPEKPVVKKQAPPPAIPKSQFESILQEASGHFDKREFRRAYNLYKAAAGFQELPEAAEAKKDTAYAMWSLKEANRDMDLRESVDPAWAQLTRARLADIDYNAFPSEADKKKYLETMKRLEKLSGGRGPGGSGRPNR